MAAEPGSAAAPGLVARRKEVETLDAFVRELESGFTALVLQGGPGIGKTTLWRHACARAEERSLPVLRAVAAGAEAHMPFAAVGDLLRTRFDELAAGLPPPQRRALAVALMLAEPGDGPSDPHAVAAGLLGCLQELALHGPLLVAIDDVQWLDASSAAAIAFAARRLRDEPVGLLLAQRTERPEPLPLGLERSPAPERVRRIEVGPLSFGAIHALVSAESGEPPPRPVLRQIHEVSGGNPLFALELAASVRSTGELAPGQRPPVPGTLREAVRERVMRLPDQTREALTAAAALAEPTVEKVARYEPVNEPWTPLIPAVDAGLISFDRERIRFSHPIYAAAVYELADPPSRRAVHKRLAAAVSDPAERAAHLALASAGPDLEVARELARAAGQAAARGAPEAAAELAEHARRLLPPAAATERATLTLAASDHVFAAGDTSGARRLLAELDGEVQGELRANVLVRLCTLATFDGTISEANALAHQALSVPVEDLALAVTINRRAAMVALMGPDLAEAEAIAKRAVELAERLGDPATLARSLASLAFLKAARRSRGWKADLDRALALDRPEGSGLIDDSPRAVAAVLAMVRGELGAARERFDAELTDALAEGGDPLATGLLFLMSERSTRAGDFPDAIELAERGLAAAEQSGQRLQRAVLLYAKALAAAHLGRADDARAAAREGLDIAERAASGWATAQNLWALGFLDLSLGRMEDAFESLSRLSELLGRGGVRELGIVPAHADAVEAALGCGRVEEARSLQQELEEAAGAAWLRAAALRGAGLVQAADGKLDDALATLTEAVAAGEEVEDGAFPLARARLALGVTLRRVKRKRDAREQLEAARASFAELGAALWATRAEEELGRIGGRTPAGDALTATERRVAELVAEGRSNKEVAAELFVSVRSVEANLTKVYAKLGLRSRVELARALADTD